jgi:hypothetical protein
VFRLGVCAARRGGGGSPKPNWPASAPGRPALGAARFAVDERVARERARLTNRYGAPGYGGSGGTPAVGAVRRTCGQPSLATR